MKPKCISDYAFLEENSESLLLSGSLMQASATLRAVQISAFYNRNYVPHNQARLGETTTLFQTFQTICPCRAALHGVQQLDFYLCRVTEAAVWQEKFRNSHLLTRAGTVWLFPCPDIHSIIRFKPLDLLRPTSKKTPPTCSKYHFKSRSFLKCLLPLQQPRMVQPPPKFLPIYYHKRLPWNTLGKPPFVRGAAAKARGTSHWFLPRSLILCFETTLSTNSAPHISPKFIFLALFLLLVFISLLLQNEIRA